MQWDWSNGSSGVVEGLAIEKRVGALLFVSCCLL